MQMYTTYLRICWYRGADKSLVRPGRKQANVSVGMAWISFGALPYRKNNLMTARVSMLLKSRAPLIYFRVCFLPGRVKDLSAPPSRSHRYKINIYNTICTVWTQTYPLIFSTLLGSVTDTYPQRCANTCVVVVRGYESSETLTTARTGVWLCFVIPRE